MLCAAAPGWSSDERATHHDDAPNDEGRHDPMTKELRRLSIVMLLMFIALFASTSVIQVVQSGSLAENPQNTRARYDSYEVQR